MSIKVYTLTPIGHKLARSVNNPDTPAYGIVSFLDKRGVATVDQVADYCGISTAQASALLSRMRREKPQVVREATEAGI